MKRVSLILVLMCLPGIAAAASPEANYLAARDRYIARFKRQAAVSSTPALDKAGLAAEHDLERQLKDLVGPFRITGFAGAGQINLDTLMAGDEGFGMLDGLVFSSPDKTTRIVVTTNGLFDAWRKGHKAWWEKTANVPADGSQALRSEPFYTQAVSTDAAVSIFADIPVVKPNGASFANAILALRSQDVGVGIPDELFVAAIAGRRVFVLNAPVEHKLQPIAACDAVWHAAEEKSSAALCGGRRRRSSA